MDRDSRDGFEDVVLQGGGIRCFWQAGVLRELRESIAFHPRRVAAVSASAGIALAFAADRLEHAVSAFAEAARANPRNSYPAYAFSRRKQVFPQAGIYRAVLEETMSPGLAGRLQDGPEILVKLTRPPRRAGSLRALALAGGLMTARKRLSLRRYHALAGRLGFRAEYLSMRACACPEDALKLVLASSCTPPFTPFYRLHGERVLDGGLLGGLPSDAMAEPMGRRLTLLTRARAPAIGAGNSGDRVLAPSREIPVSPWDYTDPDAVEQLMALGRADARHFLAHGEAEPASGGGPVQSIVA